MEPDGHIRVLVVDDHDLVRAGLVALLGHEKDIQVVGEASNGLEAINSIERFSPAVVLMDIRMPTMDGIEATACIAKEYPGVGVIAVSHLDHEEYVKRIIHAGAKGYVPKSCAADELKHAIRAVHSGVQYISPSVLKASSDHRPDTHDGCDGKGGALTPREREVLQLVATGYSNQEIADELGISIRTVEFHRANLIEKIGARDAVSIVRYAIEQKLITLEPQPGSVAEHREA